MANRVRVLQSDLARKDNGKLLLKAKPYGRLCHTHTHTLVEGLIQRKLVRSVICICKSARYNQQT